jgi:hypothetical protein
MLTVKATARGYYGDLIEEGREFQIKALGDFSERWMAPVGWSLEEERAKQAKAAEKADAKK